MSWLDQHIEEFIKPVLGDFDSSSMTPLRYFEPEEITIIKNVWRSIKQNAKRNGRKQILLPGRDVFIFEILARRENYPTIFMPECSRQTVNYIYEHLPRPVTKNCYLFDTGFAGSIPNKLNIPYKQFGLMSHDMRDSPIQIFPRLTFSRGLALKIERTPKYWESGRLAFNAGRDKEEVYQPLSNKYEFEDAARLTIEIYTSSAPKFIPHHRPVRSTW